MWLYLCAEFTKTVEKNKYEVPGQQWTSIAHFEYADKHVNNNNHVFTLI